LTVILCDATVANTVTSTSRGVQPGGDLPPGTGGNLMRVPLRKLRNLVAQ